MNKELEAFRNGFYMREENNGEVIYRYRFTNEDIDLIEKVLKALEIVKEKGNPYLICDKNEYFLLIDVGLIRLDKEEFELLKEVLG